MKEFEHIAVVGAGAIGSLLGALLSRRARVTLICRAAHAERIRREGLRITGQADTVVELEATDDPAAVRLADAALITTKAYAAADAAAAIAPHLREGAAVVFMQNGLGVEEAARGALERVPLVRGVTYHGVTFVGPGRIHWAGRGPTRFGALDDRAEPAARGLAARLADAGEEAEVSPDIRREVWKKALANIGINALGALTGLRNGELADDPHTRALMKELVAEAERAAAAQGYEFDAFADVLAIARATAGNKNSMLQDVEAGRRTEIDFLNAAAARLAAKAGFDAPVNRTVTALVKALEAARVGK